MSADLNFTLLSDLSGKIETCVIFKYEFDHEFVVVGGLGGGGIVIDCFYFLIVLYFPRVPRALYFPSIQPPCAFS